MTSKTKVTPPKEEVPETVGADTSPDRPLLDLSDAAVKKLIRAAKKRGYVTHDQINSMLRSEAVNSEQMEDVLAMFSETGINVVEAAEAEPDEDDERDEAEAEENAEGEIVEVQRPSPANVKKAEPSERADDPVGMYLRAMRSIELLSREGEMAIAKRIEAGREAMIAGLCESPLTFQATIIWRDELNEGKVFLRDIIDLEASYEGPAPRPGRRQSAPMVGRFLAPWRPPPQAPRAWRKRRRPRRPPPTPPRSTRCRRPRTSLLPGRARRPRAVSRRPASRRWTKTTWRTRSRWPRSRPSSSRRCWRPSTPWRANTSGCAACRSRTSRTGCARPRSRPRRSASTRSSRKRSSPR